jgi:hypothetical protein
MKGRAARRLARPQEPTVSWTLGTRRRPSSGGRGRRAGGGGATEARAHPRGSAGGVGGRRGTERHSRARGRRDLDREGPRTDNATYKFRLLLLTCRLRCTGTVQSRVLCVYSVRCIVRSVAWRPVCRVASARLVARGPPSRRVRTARGTWAQVGGVDPMRLVVLYTPRHSARLEHTLSSLVS